MNRFKRLRESAPTTYPSGAIQTTEELRQYLGKEVWQASRHFHICVKRFVYAIGDGFTNGATPQVIGMEDFKWYRVAPNIHSFAGYHSRKDANLDRLNGYNDWFLFAKEEDALAHQTASITRGNLQGEPQS